MGFYENVMAALDAAVVEHGSTAKLARWLNIDGSQLHRWLKRERAPQLDKLGPILDKLGYTIHTARNQTSTERSSNYIAIPIVNTHTATENLPTQGTAPYIFFAGFLTQIGAAEPSNLVLFEAAGSSMAPSINHGDIMLCDQSKTIPRSGEIFAVKVDCEILIRRIFRQPGKLLVMPDNPQYPAWEVQADQHHNQLEIFGKILWSGHILQGLPFPNAHA